ncbi:MAG: hypothetical protein H7144_09185 [Burkholderiales bacterium]|nr:hypothetical protein [Phycisphaerae bacterium]
MMTRKAARRFRSPTSAAILAQLTQRQYLAPHKPTGDVLTALAAGYGQTICSVRAAVTESGLDPLRVIGRCTRAELELLSRLIHRTFRAAALAAGAIV